jgi:hypothetical protein
MIARNEKRTTSKRPTRKRRRVSAYTRHAARLILDANCTTCGPVGTATEPWSVPGKAVLHAAKTGHVVILSGTADIPEDESRGLPREH